MSSLRVSCEKQTNKQTQRRVAIITVGQDGTGFVNLCNLVQGELVVQADIKATGVLVLYFVSDIENRHDDDDCRYM